MRGREEPLHPAIVFAIVMLWLHVAIGLIILFAVSGVRADQGPAVAWAFFWSLVYSTLAILLQRRWEHARMVTIVVIGMAYLIGLLQGRIISTLLLILIPLLFAPSESRTSGVRRYWF